MEVMTGLTEDSLRGQADALWQAAETGEAIAPVRESLPAAGIDDAYAIQQINTERGLALGRRLVGRKIGLTAKVVQAQLGVDQPDYGMLFADMAVDDGEEIPWSRLMQPKVEAEVAFVLGRPLEETQPTLADLLRAVDYAVPALEIVGSRIRNWDIKIVDTIADNASSGLFVLGGSPRLLREFDLRLCGMVMERRGEQVSIGAGAACLGSPLNALRWLAAKMAAVGQPLQAGDIVLSGALGPMAPAAPGEVFEARIEGLGSVRATFGTA